MYRLTYIQGNGYYCNCCRHTTICNIDFKNEIELIDYLVKKYKLLNKGECEFEDELDWELKEIREIKSNDLTSKYYELVNNDILNNKNVFNIRTYKIKKILLNYENKKINKTITRE